MGSWNQHYLHPYHQAIHPWKNQREFWGNVEEKSWLLSDSGEIKSKGGRTNDQAKTINHQGQLRVWSEENRTGKDDKKQIKLEENVPHLGLDDLWKSQDLSRCIIYSIFWRG